MGAILEYTNGKTLSPPPDAGREIRARLFWSLYKQMRIYNMFITSNSSTYHINHHIHKKNRKAT